MKMPKSVTLVTKILKINISKAKNIVFFFYQGFFHRHWRLTGQQRKGGVHLLFHSTTSTCSRTFRHLFATLHVRWLSHIFNRTACIYQAATRWDFPPYWKNIVKLDIIVIMQQNIVVLRRAYVIQNIGHLKKFPQFFIMDQTRIITSS